MVDEIAIHVSELAHSEGIVPGLAVVLVGEDPASQVYVRNKGIKCRAAGMRSFEHKLSAECSQAELLTLIDRLNSDPTVHGILVQLPLPSHLDTEIVINSIEPAKDVDGFHAVNVGRLATGQAALVPCTPLGCLMLLRAQLGSLAGLEAVIVGRSNIVGKPMAQLLLRENCTATIVHSQSRDIASICRRADILVAAVGRPEMISGDWIKPGAVVIDVGINRLEREGVAKLVGDVVFDQAKSIASAITPVPGGVGPMTIACLLANTLTACRRIHGLPDSRAFAAR
ncbi:bifunctional methylenetetrahydrofolate dehydrogenase/methenyltetrahydrofolate cyclohydrolase [Rhizobium sp. AC44/96]|nr:bifunctional methylenetetrahydrofolate dehydrogenase/methenyltetrahydrofolate cyclohydrolase [Rhizobium sp. AC44/96]